MAPDTTYLAQTGGVIVNLSEAQSIEIEGSFNCQITEQGWMMVMQAAGKVTLHFRSNMRRIEYAMLENDQLVRSRDDLLIIRSHSPADYRQSRSSGRAGSYTPSSREDGSRLARTTTRQMGSPLASDVEQIIRSAEDRSTSQ